MRSPVNGGERIGNYRSRAKAHGAAIVGYDLTPERLKQRASVFGDECAYCGGSHALWDHLIPLSSGGNNCLANLRPCCFGCNAAKRYKTAMAWLIECIARKAKPNNFAWFKMTESEIVERDDYIQSVRDLIVPISTKPQPFEYDSVSWLREGR